MDQKNPRKSIVVVSPTPWTSKGNDCDYCRNRYPIPLEAFALRQSALDDRLHSIGRAGSVLIPSGGPNSRRPSVHRCRVHSLRTPTRILWGVIDHGRSEKTISEQVL